MNIIEEFLPENCYKDRPLDPKGAVIHYISAKYTNPENPFDRNSIRSILEQYKLSYHFYVSPMGDVYQWTPSDKQAKHAGYSSMNGRELCNGFTYGIALGGMAHLHFPRRQIIATGQLLASLMTKDRFTTDWIQGHDEVRAAWNDDHPFDQSDRKNDPGPLFPWQDLIEMIKGAQQP